MVCLRGDLYYPKASPSNKVLLKSPSTFASITLLGLVLLASGCAQREVAAAPELKPAAAPAFNVYNDSAQWLAGIPGRPDGPFYALEAEPAWQKYSAALAEKWKTANTKQFGPLDAFQKRE